MPEAAAILVRDLVREFPGVKAVDHLSFEVNYGEIFGLVGPDGAGKTTTMRILAGVLLPDSGEAQVAGFDVARDAERVKQKISYMSQRFGLYEDLTVDENIRFYAEVFGVKRAPLPRAQRTSVAGRGYAAVPPAPRRQTLRRHEAKARTHLRSDPHSAGSAVG